MTWRPRPRIEPRPRGVHSCLLHHINLFFKIAHAERYGLLRLVFSKRLAYRNDSERLSGCLKPTRSNSMTTRLVRSAHHVAHQKVLQRRTMFSVRDFMRRQRHSSKISCFCCMRGVLRWLVVCKPPLALLSSDLLYSSYSFHFSKLHPEFVIICAFLRVSQKLQIKPECRFSARKPFCKSK